MKVINTSETVAAHSGGDTFMAWSENGRLVLDYGYSSSVNT